MGNFFSFFLTTHIGVGIFSSKNNKQLQNPIRGPYQLRQIQCSLAKWACFKCPNGAIDTKYHPFFLDNGQIRKDTVKPTFLQQGGVPLWWWKIILFIGASAGLSFVQSQGDVPSPFDNTIFNLTGMFIFGAFFFARITFLFTRNFAAAQYAYAAQDGAVSLSQHMASLMTPDEIKKFPDIVVEHVRYDVENCSTYVEEVPVSEVYCEASYVAAALGYAMVFSFRETGVIAEKLPMHDQSRRELAYRVGASNKDHLGVMLQMLEERIMIMVGAKLYKRPLRELTQQVDALNSIFAKLDEINSLVPGILVNKFLTFWLYVWLVFLVWIFPFSQPINVFLTSLVQILAIGTLSFLEAEGLPFDNTETNPYSTIPIQDIKHTIAVAALGASLSLFDRVDAYKNFTPRVGATSRSLQLEDNPENKTRWNNQMGIDSYNNTYVA